MTLKSCHKPNSTSGDEVRMTAQRRCLRGLATAAGGADPMVVRVGVLTIVGKTSGGVGRRERVTGGIALCKTVGGLGQARKDLAPGDGNGQTALVR
nr:hypothetical protein MFLOJ_44290 [Mycobacterium florentinum]